MLAKDTIAELKHKRPVGGDPAVSLTEPGEIKHPLQLKSMLLPDTLNPGNVEIQPQPSTSTTGCALQDATEDVPPLIQLPSNYTTSLGMIVPLSAADLEIDPNLLQPGPQLPNLPNEENQTTMADSINVSTVPCSINLLRLHPTDIAKWDSTKNSDVLPDATERNEIQQPDGTSTDVPSNNGYYLHKREIATVRSSCLACEVHASVMPSVADPGGARGLSPPSSVKISHNKNAFQ